jgi:diaminohydroxyphosphoribosylaminopyrimidine deaminase/5-amino-6-(5-phosphoribosylamino)uracil reductase
MEDLTKYMKHAYRLASKGSGWVNPNPMVGAVLVKDGTIIGEGFHEYFGGPHAEVNAIKSAKRPVEGATLFVTLEPCAHQGKTPPCAELIVNERIETVYIGLADPNPQVNGKGIDFLRSHGVRVHAGLMEADIRKQNEVFIKFITSRKPFVLYKNAMTLDGKIATVTGDSRWVSNETSRKFVHELRHSFFAVMVGIGTVLKDNPRLDVRRNRKLSRDPLKIIVDSMARIPVDAEVIAHNPQLTIIAVTHLAESSKLQQIRRTGAQVIVCPERNRQVDLEYLILALGSMDIDSILLEGGGNLAFSALQAGIIDKMITVISPGLIGGKNAPTPMEGSGYRRMTEAVKLSDVQVKNLKGDILIEGYVHRDH